MYISTSCHAMSHDPNLTSKQNMALTNVIGHCKCHDIIDVILLFEHTAECKFSIC